MYSYLNDALYALLSDVNNLSPAARGYISQLFTHVLSVVSKKPNFLPVTCWRDVAKQVGHAWNEGMQTLRSPKAAPHFRGQDNAIAEAGFSGPRKPERSREVIGRSELLTKKTLNAITQTTRINLSRSQQPS